MTSYATVMARTPKVTGVTPDREDQVNGSNANSELPWSAQGQKSGQLFPSVSDPQISYTLPQWLVPERYKDKQSSQNATHTRIFSVPLLKTDTKTRQAVRAYLSKHHLQQKSGLKDSERKLRELKFEEKQATSKAKAAKDKLAQALFARSEKLKEIRKANEAETTKAMEELEAKMRKEQHQEDMKIKEKRKEECRLEYEKKFEEEMLHKRKREQEEDEKEAASTVKKAREGKNEKETESKSSSSDDVVEGNNVRRTMSKVELLEKKQDELKEKMDKLSEKKSELFWLLKQVIKHESLRKMKKLEKKNEQN